MESMTSYGGRAGLEWYHHAVTGIADEIREKISSLNGYAYWSVRGRRRI